MRSINAISIIVPTLNEADNILPLVERISNSLKQHRLAYEIIFVDDHSTDKTLDRIKQSAIDHPVKYQLKHGKRGKAYSLRQGFKAARYDVICMIDADLQYPPEAIAPMFELLEKHGSDIIITKRHAVEISRLRKLSTRIFNYTFVYLLFGFDYDTQSGLKLFRKRVIDTITIAPRQWSFDLEFIVRALEENFKILSYDINFAARYSGKAKVSLLSSTLELVTESLKLRFHSSGKKLRRAYQANVRYMQQTFGMLLAGGVLMVIILAAAGHTAADSILPIKTIQPVQSIINQLTQPAIPTLTVSPQTTTPMPIVSPLTPIVTPVKPTNTNVLNQTATAVPSHASKLSVQPVKQQTISYPPEHAAGAAKNYEATVNDDHFLNYAKYLLIIGLPLLAIAFIVRRRSDATETV